MPKDYHLHLRGTVGGWNFDREYTNYVLDRNKDKEVNVLICSLGGSADTGLAINSLFKIHSNVHVHFVGMNASAATIAAMGAKRITIDSGACFLVHKCLNAVCDWDWKNADQLEARIAELRKLKDDLNAIDSVVAGIYARRCKKTKDEMMALMKTGGWLTPQQALEWGFVDEITDYKEDEKPVMTEAVASAICAVGMPMPPIKVEKDSFFDRLRRFFQSEASGNPAVIGSTPPPAPEKRPENSVVDNDDNDDNPDNQSNYISMKKFPLLAALLGVTIAAEGDSAFSPSADHLQKIEDCLASKDKEISDLKADAEANQSKIDELDKTVADLKKAPAAASGDINETSAKQDSDGPGDDIDSVVAEFAKAFLS